MSSKAISTEAIQDLLDKCPHQPVWLDEGATIEDIQKSSAAGLVACGWMLAIEEVLKLAKVPS